ncbi:MAG: lipoate--protein ligase family protein [Acidimicrobiales bacterium]
MPAGSSWTIDERHGAAGGLHRSWPAVESDPSRRAVAVCRVSGPAVVLGSTQAPGVVDVARAEARGIEVVRRRSGGGAVLVTPDDPVWIDVWVPRDDRLWSHDVGRAFDWLGDTWTAALRSLGAPGVRAHRDGFAACTRWSSLVCFGGVGTGEVVAADGRKVVGISQRRNRDGAWFHGACIRHWDPTALLEVMDLSAEDREAARLELAAAVVGVADLVDGARVADVEPASVVAGLVAALPS